MALNILVVSHGGMLRAAFGEPKFHNCEYRVYDLRLDGSFVRVSSGAQGKASMPASPLPERNHRTAPLPTLELEKVVVTKVSPVKIFQLRGFIDSIRFERDCRFT